MKGATKSMYSIPMHSILFSLYHSHSYIIPLGEESNIPPWI